MSTLETRLSQAIKDRSFNVLEITGFRVEPDLALLAGAAIGYQLGLDDAIDKIIPPLDRLQDK